MRQKQQPEAELLDDKKGFKIGDRKAYRKGNKIIVEKGRDIIETEEIENPKRDYSAILYKRAKA